MGLAYCILAHKNPAQIGRLLRAIWHPDNVYALHYDKRAPQAEHEAIRELAGSFPNVRLLPSRAILWGRYSQVATQLEGMRACLESSAPWTHWFTLSGQDFPLKPQSEMIDELSAAASLSYLSHFDPFDGIHWRNAEYRLRLIHLDSPLLERVLAIPGIGRRIRQWVGWTNRMPYVPQVMRKPPAHFTCFGGSNHVILSREAAAYIVTDSRARAVIRWLRWTGHPDETVFQSTLLNGPLASQTVNDDRRAVFWSKPGDPSPRTLALSDLEALRQARREGKLFARKFDAAADEALLGAMERELASPAKEMTPVKTPRGPIWSL